MVKFVWFGCIQRQIHRGEGHVPPKESPWKWIFLLIWYQAEQKRTNEPKRDSPFLIASYNFNNMHPTKQTNRVHAVWTTVTQLSVTPFIWSTVLQYKFGRIDTSPAALLVPVYGQLIRRCTSLHGYERNSENVRFRMPAQPHGTHFRSKFVIWTIPLLSEKNWKRTFFNLAY